MVAIVVSLLVAAVGAWLTLTENDSMTGALGAMLMVVGATLLVANLFLRRASGRMAVTQSASRCAACRRAKPSWCSAARAVSPTDACPSC